MNKFNLINWFYFDILSLSSHIMLRKMFTNNMVLIMYIMTSSSLFISNFQFAFNWQQNDYLMKKSWNTQNVACKEAPSLVFKTYIFVGKSTKMEKQLLVRYWHSSAPCRKYWKKTKVKRACEFWETSLNIIRAVIFESGSLDYIIYSNQNCGLPKAYSSSSTQIVNKDMLTKISWI